MEKQQNNNNNNNNKNKSNDNNKQSFNYKNRSRYRKYNNNRGRNGNKKWYNNQNVIKVNRPKNTIQRFSNQNNKNSRIKGKDLIIQADNNLVNQTSGIFAIIPINPLYWQGTRIKNMALQYQYYLPRNISLEYVPNVSKFQSGTITIGCITKQIVNQSTIQQTLISSTSGESFSCSEFFRKTIALNSLLQQKKLLLSSDISKESVPFYIIIYLSGILVNNKLIAPGTFYFNYDIEFFNPITETMNYKTDNSILISNIDQNQQNISLILLQQNGALGVGALIDVEKRNQAIIFKYNGSDVTLDNNKYVTAFYSSIPGLVTQDYKSEFDLTDFIYASDTTQASVPALCQICIIDTQNRAAAIYQSTANDTALNITVNANKYYYITQSSSDTVINKLQQVEMILTSLTKQLFYVKMEYQLEDVNFINEHELLNECKRDGNEKVIHINDNQ